MLGQERGADRREHASDECGAGAFPEISAALILRLHSLLLADQPRHTPPRRRQEPVWIGTRADSPIGAKYVAPSFERIPDLIEDLTAFTVRRDLRPLVVVALSHAQFETIHPVTDGNGRTGRALAQSALRHRGVTPTVSVPVSAGLLADVSATIGRSPPLARGIRTPSSAPSPLLRSAPFGTLVSSSTRSPRSGSRGTTDCGCGGTVPLGACSTWLLDAGHHGGDGGGEGRSADPERLLSAAITRQGGILLSKQEHRLGPLWRSDEIRAAVDRCAERAGRSAAY
ncbi:Fic family protein [Rathayibacter rathayi]|uniref:Fic family protein n=1 Tax=Rathayibacter rathayi TaxID=33887 RepID=UPI000BDD46C8|nr:hypothetical protein C1O28_13515 [Rathayibacter rathayi]MWV74643.1 hypothetical protein [Rathayibacter rathayi NCPPB 2980 = VKM Ac-1601]PPF23266.1 hypothetical protein C5C34_09490 [Rathayibacter rathayi]PPF42005.1 hypothetical protein C5C08_15495 [Rathayibacter rathayi]PPF74058.1 hypothetical protein C5C14_15670 [Rathayibacter rathayi]